MKNTIILSTIISTLYVLGFLFGLTECKTIEKNNGNKKPRYTIIIPTERTIYN